MKNQQDEKKHVTPGVTPVGKKELCVALGWSRARLDRRIEWDPQFPVLQCGTQGGGWRFDPAEVQAHLEKVPVVSAPGRPSGNVGKSRAADAEKCVAVELAQTASLRRAVDACVSDLTAMVQRAQTMIDELQRRVSSPVPLEHALWSTKEIGDYLQRPAQVVRERIVCLPGFPAAIRLPSMDGGKGFPRWKAAQVIEWVESHQGSRHRRRSDAC